MTVETQWKRIVDWCEANTPATARALRPGSAPEVVDAAIEATGVNWTGELREFYLLNNGMQRDDPETGAYAGSIFPMHDLIDLDEVLETRLRMRAVTQELLASDPVVSPEQGAEFIREYERQDAGSVAGWFLSSFIPFASRDGYMYFVDTRPGPRSGCVTGYAHSDADNRGPVWSNVAEMLEIHADALTTGSPIRNFIPSADDGVLKWHLIDDGRSTASAKPASSSYIPSPDDEKIKNEARRRLLGR
ncbi:hypothetical protein E5720_18815 [Rhodococcus sp. PAMC28707]|uniref:SMI1/KNR4 family protein n=1 Tax=unclassified Rhodococcus (in: high G+C Gram-positive bacteria) TaxID=192944 RepID=UPI00109DF03E|nr:MULTISPECIES: SMI1/KNR4 family protein [unclassified Rhodococcus (in: high G+C Gram-positive bacteria)]QCB51611.1 hypothetical protein E5769_16710 [Rhodococcus sp. PAMC28705]QCB60221.1 hypothetical protein E5720_18815 [Rhodococcus sp. PAMC28707]